MPYVGTYLLQIYASGDTPLRLTDLSTDSAWNYRVSLWNAIRCTDYGFAWRGKELQLG